ncbi:MAG: rhomboid family intramembrane serine protease [Longimicrobiaceae bacterium]
MIPIKDENPTEIVPYVNYLFIGLNVAAWFLLQGAGDPNALQASVFEYGSVPCEVTGRCEVEGLSYLALVTSMFMHGGWAHLIGNMLFLWVFGNNIEDSMGHLRYIAFYLVSGLAAAAVHIFTDPSGQVPMVGASGAISGVMGAYVLLYPKVRVRYWFPPLWIFELRAIVALGYWFLIQLASGVVSLGPEAPGGGGVAFWAHVGGFVAGLALIKLFEKKELSGAKRSKRKLTRSEVARLEW